MDYMGTKELIMLVALAIMISAVTYFGLRANWYQNQLKKAQGLHRTHAIANQKKIDSLYSTIEQRDGVIVAKQNQLKDLEKKTTGQLEDLKLKEKEIKQMEYKNSLLEDQYNEALNQFDTAVINNDTPYLDSLRRAYFPGQPARR